MAGKTVERETVLDVGPMVCWIDSAVYVCMVEKFAARVLVEAVEGAGSSVAPDVIVKVFVERCRVVRGVVAAMVRGWDLNIENQTKKIVREPRCDDEAINVTWLLSATRSNLEYY